MIRLVSIVWLAIIWVILWGEIDVRSVVGGVVVATAIVMVFPPSRAMGFDAFRPIAALRFLASYSWQIVSANAIVAWEVVTPGSRVNEGIVKVPISGASDAVVTVLANVISGTPGTLILEVEREPATVLYVHVLHLRDIEQVRCEILRLECLLVRAIGSEQSVLAAEAHLAAAKGDVASNRRDDP